MTLVTDSAHFEHFLSKADGNLVVIHFSAPWAPQCGQVQEVLTELSKKSQFTNAIFLQLEAEKFPELSMKHKITAVPTCILLRDDSEVDRINGADVPELTKKLELHSSPYLTAKPPADEPKLDLNTRLKQLINKAPVMLFMKGHPEEPKCKFSRATVEILKNHQAVYSTFDILADEEVRQGLKTYSQWPTYPQLYIDGELIGGIDIIKEMVESGEFKDMLPKQQTLEDRLKTLIRRSKVMLFMKGEPTNPKCGFSRTITQILSETGVEYGHFDILTDEEVRQGLKKFSDWPTFPQLYVNGELIGGLDIVREMKESGDLEDSLKA